MFFAFLSVALSLYLSISLSLWVSISTSLYLSVSLLHIHTYTFSFYIFLLLLFLSFCLFIFLCSPIAIFPLHSLIYITFLSFFSLSLFTLLTSTFFSLRSVNISLYLLFLYLSSLNPTRSVHSLIHNIFLSISFLIPFSSLFLHQIYTLPSSLSQRDSIDKDVSLCCPQTERVGRAFIKVLS